MWENVWTEAYHWGSCDVRQVIIDREENKLQPFGRPALLGHIENPFGNFNKVIHNFIADILQRDGRKTSRWELYPFE